MKIDVKHVAKLANLQLTKDELEKLDDQLSTILDYIENLKKVNTNNKAETSQTTGLENITREDKTSPSLSQDDSLSNTKQTENGFFKAKAVFKENET